MRQSVGIFSPEEPRRELRKCGGKEAGKRSKERSEFRLSHNWSLSLLHSFCEARELPHIIRTGIEEKVPSGGNGQVMVTIFLI